MLIPPRRHPRTPRPTDKTKLQLIAVLAVVGGIACLLLARWSITAAAPSWLAALPIAEIGSTLFGTGLLAVFFEYIDRQHGDELFAHLQAATFVIVN